MAKPAEIKTKQTDSSVEDFLNSVTNQEQRKDSFHILKLMQKASKEKPRMWGSSMIGFGIKRYKSPASGREVDWFIIGFSPRKANLSLHIGANVPMNPDTLKKLGKHKTGSGCLYINNLKDIDLKVLEQMINVAAKAK